MRTRYRLPLSLILSAVSSPLFVWSDLVLLSQKQTASLPAGVAALLASAVIGSANIAQAADYAPPPQQNEAQQQQKQDTRTFQGGASQAPAVKSSSSDYQLPEGNQWRYSEFINAVQAGKVERVRFSKDGSQLQLTAVDGRRALVVLPNDPDLVDILAKNGVDISVSEGEQQGNYVALLGNLLFPVIAFAGLFFLFRRSGGGQGGGGPMGGMGGPMDFGKSKSKFQEVPETGITFADVAVSCRNLSQVACMAGCFRTHLIMINSALAASVADSCCAANMFCVLSVAASHFLPLLAMPCM